MAIKSKTQTPDVASIVAAVLASMGQATPQAQPVNTSGKWDFKVLAQEGTAAIVMATPPKGAAFKALATVSDSGRVKLGFKLDGTTLAKGFVKLLGSIQ